MPPIRTVALAVAIGAAASTAAAQSPAGQELPSIQRSIERWIDLQTALFVGRFQRVETSAGVVTSNHLQDNITIKARFKFDARGRYTITAGVETGATFIGGWNNVGVGTGGPGTAVMYLRQLFVTAAPVAGVGLSYGALPIVRGESTEISSYDNDGYMTGERVSVKRPSSLYLDEITVTTGYLGDATTPGFIDRYHRLIEWNYGHALARKKLAPWLAVSGDTPRTRVVDVVRYEQYQRVGSTGAFGFAAYGEKTFAGRLSAGLGYADIDENYGGLNADRFQRGRRVFEQSAFALTRDLSASVYVTQAVHNAFPVSNHFRVDLALSYNALTALQHAGLFRP